MLEKKNLRSFGAEPSKKDAFRAFRDGHKI